MKKTIALMVAILASVSFSGRAQQRPAQASIQGVWRVVEQTINDRTLKDKELGVGFHIYTEGYFAAVRESDVPPRPNVEDVTKATAGQLLAVWGPFVAQLGTYEITGDRIVHRTLVAKNPDNQSGTGGPGQRIRFEGNTLVLEPIQRVAGNRQITLKMVRVE